MPPVAGIAPHQNFQLILTGTNARSQIELVRRIDPHANGNAVDLNLRSLAHKTQIQHGIAFFRPEFRLVQQFAAEFRISFRSGNVKGRCFFRQQAECFLTFVLAEDVKCQFQRLALRFHGECRRSRRDLAAENNKQQIFLFQLQLQLAFRGGAPVAAVVPGIVDQAITGIGQLQFRSQCTVDPLVQEGVNVLSVPLHMIGSEILDAVAGAADVVQATLPEGFGKFSRGDRLKAGGKIECAPAFGGTSRQAFRKDHGQAFFRKAAQIGQHMRRQNFTFGYDQRTVILDVDDQPAVLHRRRQQNIVGNDVEIHKVLRQLPADIPEGLVFSVRPMAFGVVEHRHIRLVLCAAKQMGAATHVFHQIFEQRILFVSSAVIEMGRAVRILFLRREGMGHEVVDAGDQHRVRQRLHIRQTLAPAECAEDLAHGTALLQRLDVGLGSCQLGHGVAEKRRICRTIVIQICPMDAVRKSRHILEQHDVDARHILPLGTPEEMAGTVGHVHMAILILDDVADVQNAPLPAPIAQLIAEVIPEELRDRFHVVRPDGGGDIA